MDEQTLAVRNDPDHDRYVVTADGDPVGFAAYRASGDVVTFTHTEIDDRVEGQGVGSRLAREALEDVRAQGKQIRPLCAFIAAYVQRHPEFQDLVV